MGKPKKPRIIHIDEELSKTPRFNPKMQEPQKDTWYQGLWREFNTSGFSDFFAFLHEKVRKDQQKQHSFNTK